MGKQTTNLASINKTLLRGLPVPVPPLDEQNEVARRVSAFAEAVDAQQEKLDELHTLKKGLLQDLLTGEVRVTDVDVSEIEEQVDQQVGEPVPAQ